MPRLYLAQGQALASTYNRWRNYTPARAISRARSEYRGELGHTWEALYSRVSPNFPLVSIDSQLACEIGVTIDSNGARPSKRQKGHFLLYNNFAFPPKQVRTPNTRSRLTQDSPPSPWPLFLRGRYQWWRSGRYSRRSMFFRVRSLSFFDDVFTDDCGPCRQVLHDIPQRGQGRPLSQDVAHASRHEQLHPAVRNV